MVVDRWSTHLEMELRDQIMQTEGGWPSDTRSVLQRVADLAGTYVIVLVACGATLLLLELLGVPIS